ncbi:hypothetical protein ACRALDRAFT_1083349 [Sodiomyces alcalophilus JCM 7366]|uniref:uncharacterized protein n=1 Tax=Sodiomyces alcalophilus JCM 7366 TaxID=591952 RepID=UPI0039B3865D
MPSNSSFSDTEKPSKKAKTKAKLLDSDSEDSDGGVDLANTSELKINEEYARRFEHNKKREERQRLEEKYKNSNLDDDDDSDSDSSSEDEEGFLVTEELDAQISATLSAIKNKDPRVRDKNFKFFQSTADDEDPGPSKKKEKPLRLKDYHREKILAGDVGASDDEEEVPPQTYVQEQEALKKSIVSEIHKATADGDSDDQDSDDQFVTRKEKPKEKLDTNGVHPSRAAVVSTITETDVVNADKDPETFLSNFMASRAWVHDGGRNWEAFESDDDDGHVDKAEEFEQAYNLRFEDPHKSNEVLRSYARDITASKSVRREELTGRKRQRQLEKEKQEAEKQQRREEKARLRRMKLEEAEAKLAKIKQAAGLSGKDIKEEDWMWLLDGAWDDKKWEEEMQKRFGDDYYAEPEVGSSGDEEDGGKKKKRKPKKPKWDDDIDITDIVPDFEDDSKPDITLTDDEDEHENEDDEDDGDGDGRPAKKRRTTKDHKKERLAAKQAAKAERRKLEALVDARMDLDHPDVLAGAEDGDPEAAETGKQAAARMRFRYRETSPQSFGLTPRDILFAPSDSALNQFAGLKKLAPFRDPEKKRKDKKRLGKKARLREWRRETFGRAYEHTGPSDDFAAAAFAAADRDREKRRKKREARAGDAEEAVTPTVTADGDGDGQAKKRKRKRSKGKKNQGDDAAAAVATTAE